MAKIEKTSVIITQAVAVKGKHYPADDKKPVSLDAADARFLLIRKKARFAKPEKGDE